MNIQSDSSTRPAAAMPIAVVTGAGGGLGLALTQQLAQSGYRVAMADMDLAALESAAATLSNAVRPQLRLHVTDVTDLAALEQLAHTVSVEWDTPDLVINNAGLLGPISHAWDGDIDAWRLALEVNIWGVIHSMRAFMPGMIAADRGRIVNIASAASWSSAPMMAAYGAAKHAVLALTESAYRELRAAHSQVQVSAVCPNTIRTGLLSALGDPAQEPDTEDARRKLFAAREAGMNADDVAALILREVAAGSYLIATEPDWVLHAAQQRVQIAQGGAPPLDRQPPRR
ncbi:MAG: SDR family oxidoreductase [Beutenbergiaceae bacterium]